ncbi:MAG: helix-turn-helix domain-containing protein [Gemmatimonadota bacterium]
MSIGRSLAEARQQAGLTVADVSQRTRIREGIIRGIEADDFSVCGGDFYARGHIRSIAKVIGTDPVPLVTEYDRVWREQGGSTDVRHVMDLITDSRVAPPGDAGTPPPPGPPDGPGTGPVREPGTWPGDAPGPGQPGRPGARSPDEADTGPLGIPGAGPVGGPGTSHPGEPGSWREPGSGPVPEPGSWREPEPGAGPVPEPGSWREPEPGAGPVPQPAPWPGGMPDGVQRDEQGPAPWGTSSPTIWRTPAAGRRAAGSAPLRQRLNWTAVLAVAVVLAFGLIGYQLMSGSGGQPSPAAAPAASGRAGTQHPAEHGSGTPVPQRTRLTPAASPTPTPPVVTTPPNVVSKPLSPASAVAFGSGGAGQGDNTDLAHLAVDHSPGSAWHTDWYTSASFGNLYSGTGLLVDLGRAATITGARVTLGSAPGATFELKAGSAPGTLRTVARADGVSGLVNLRLRSPVHGRYLLIWFTRLPDDAGTFQASVHDVKVTVQA